MMEYGLGKPMEALRRHWHHRLAQANGRRESGLQATKGPKDPQLSLPDRVCRETALTMLP